jgi:hypothetical protein
MKAAIMVLFGDGLVSCDSNFLFTRGREEEGGLSKFKRLVCCIEKPQFSEVSLNTLYSVLMV